MTNPQGSYIWYELMTSDTAAAASFYDAVIGWSDRAFDETDSYRMFSVGETAVAGLMTIPADAASNGMTPGWLGYVGVDDVDATVAAATAHGGAVHMPPTDIPGVGRIALIADPQGAVYYVMRGAGDDTSGAFDPATPGHGAWHELTTGDWEAAFGFYQALFGWEKREAIPMGPMGTYQLFASAGGDAIGGMMNAPGRPRWQYYFGIDDIDAAKARIEAAGGTIGHGPQEVPGGAWIIQGTDPQGATFAVTGPRGG